MSIAESALEGCPIGTRLSSPRRWRSGNFRPSWNSIRSGSGCRQELELGVGKQAGDAEGLQRGTGGADKDRLGGGSRDDEARDQDVAAGSDKCARRNVDELRGRGPGIVAVDLREATPVSVGLPVDM